MKYEVNGFIKDCLVFSTQFKSITGVARFIDGCDTSILDLQIYRIGTLQEIDAKELLKIWRFEHE